MRARASGSAPSLLLLGGSISAGATAGPNLQLHSQLARMNAVLAPGFEGDGQVECRGKRKLYSGGNICTGQYWGAVIGFDYMID